MLNYYRLILNFLAITLAILPIQMVSFDVLFAPQLCIFDNFHLIQMVDHQESI
jgi:hypothetical protein